MSDIKSENTKYFAAVMQVISEWHKLEAEIESEKQTIAQFVDYITKNADEISKFLAVENEIVELLNNYSFIKGINLSPAKNILQPLPNLKQKLITLGAEAKKLAGKPDRHDCHRAMEICKNLTLSCMNNMKSADYNTVSELLDQNIQKLLEIQNRFADEDAKVFNLSKKIQKLSAQIKNYADRFNKNAVLNKSQQLLQSAEEAKFANFGHIKQNLEQCIKSIETVIKSFDKEHNDTIALRNQLGHYSPNSWSEDNDELISEINDVVSNGTATSNFSLQAFFDREKNNRQKKSNDIASFRKQYGRIAKRYGSQLQSEIIDEYVLSSELQRWLTKYKAIESKRLKKIAKIVSIGVGIAVGIWLIIWLIIAFWKQILIAIAVITVIVIIIACTSKN
jgi:hypothetical protein